MDIKNILFVWLIALGTLDSLVCSANQTNQNQTKPKDYTPLTDLIFKKIFQEHISLLKDLINSIVSTEDQIRDVIQINPFFIGISDEERPQFTSVDVLAMSDTEEWFHIEVQVVREKYYLPRALFYWSECYRRQIKKQTKIDYGNLKKVISVHILNFTEPVLKNCTSYVHDAHIVFSDMCPFKDHLEIILLELPKYLKKYRASSTSKIETKLDAWLTYFSTVKKVTSTEINEGFNKYRYVKQAAEIFRDLVLTEQDEMAIIRQQADLNERLKKDKKLDQVTQKLDQVTQKNDQLTQKCVQQEKMIKQLQSKLTKYAHRKK